MKMLSKVVEPTSRAQWRKWLARNHASEKEIWLLSDADEPAVSYLDAVEEALCFGWIDSVGKRLSETLRGQRFSPRRPRSNWTEMNKARVRRLISLKLMTDAGRAVLPDLDTPFTIAPDIVSALKKTPGALAYFEACPLLYRRIRAGYVEEQRKRAPLVDPDNRRPVDYALRQRQFESAASSAPAELLENWRDGRIKMFIIHRLLALRREHPGLFATGA